MQQEKTNLMQLFPRFSEKRLLIIGDLMVDRYVIGSVDRISPEAPVPVVLVREEREVLGGAANVASLLTALGAGASLCGVIGADRGGEVLSRRLQEIGVDTALLHTHGTRPTTVKTRVVAHKQQVVRVDREDNTPFDDTTMEQLLQQVERALPGVDGVIISDYGKGVVLPRLIRETVRLCREQDKLVAVDPKVEHFLQYQGVTLITPNNKEASEGIGIPIRDPESLKRAGRLIQEKLAPRILLVTRSEHGMALFEQGKELVEIPTVARDVFDVTGAGDMVIAAFSLALACGATPYQAALLSNYAAGLEVQKFGCQPVSRAELQEAVERG